MKTLAAIAFALLATTACATNEPEQDGLELRHAGDIIEGTYVEQNASVDFRITQTGHQVAIEIDTRDGYKHVENIRLTVPELALVRKLPRVLAVEGIDIKSAIDAR
jgi:hypothetical protein